MLLNKVLNNNAIFFDNFIDQSTLTFQLIVAFSITIQSLSCNTFQMIACKHLCFTKAPLGSFNDGFQLVVKFKKIIELIKAFGHIKLIELFISINHNKVANIFNQVKLIDVIVSEGAQDVDQASMCKESFKLTDASNAEGMQASPNIQTYCCVKLAALRLPFIVELDSQGEQQNDQVVSVSALSIESAMLSLLAASATNSLVEHNDQISPSSLINLIGHMGCISHVDLIGLSGINSIVGLIGLVNFGLNLPQWPHWPHQAFQAQWLFRRSVDCCDHKYQNTIHSVNNILRGRYFWPQ
jgi:hypothetical protein